MFTEYSPWKNISKLCLLLDYFAGISESVTKPLSLLLADAKLPKKYKVNISTEGDRKKKRDKRMIRPELSSFIYMFSMAEGRHILAFYYICGLVWLQQELSMPIYGCVIFFDEKRNLKISTFLDSILDERDNWIWNIFRWFDEIDNRTWLFSPDNSIKIRLHHR